MRSYARSETDRHLFVGPTASPELLERARAAGFVIRPPIRRGDVKLLSDEEPGVIVIVDGVFQQSLAVGHAELRTALQRGWTLWGLGSMGAIRAFEMGNFGMRGFGLVFAHFLADDDFQDDELALLHSPTPPYVCASEPLIHIRHFVRAMEDAGALDRQEAHEIIDNLKERWFGERTVPLTLQLIRQYSGLAAAKAAEAAAPSLDLYRVKTRDLERFLTERAWCTPDYSEPPRPAPYSRTIIASLRSTLQDGGTATARRS